MPDAAKIVLPVYLNSTRKDLLFTVDLQIKQGQRIYEFHERGVAIIASTALNWVLSYQYYFWHHTFHAFKTSDSNYYYSCDVIGDRASILFMLKYLNMHNIYLLYSILCIPDLNSRKNALLGRLFGDDWTSSNWVKRQIYRDERNWSRSWKHCGQVVV